MAIWALAAAPLFMSTDLQNVSASSKAILLNRELLQISQDPLGRAGRRFYHDIESGRQGWLRELQNGDVAVALHNGGGNCSIPTWAKPVPPRCHGNYSLNVVDNCEWQTFIGGYNESCGGGAGNDGCILGDVSTVKAACCGLGKECVSFSTPIDGSCLTPPCSCLKKNDGCGWNANATYQSLVKTKQGPQKPSTQGWAQTITIDAQMIDFAPNTTMAIFDVYDNASLGTHMGKFVSKPIAPHGVQLLRISFVPMY